MKDVMAKTIVPLAFALLAGTPALGADDKDPAPRPRQIDALYACQAITDPAQRLACFDGAVKTVQAADASGEVIFADRQQVKKAKQGLFGLGNIRLGIFSRGDDDPEDEMLEQIEASVRSISPGSNGKLLVILDDGARWVQTDGSRVLLKAMQSKKVTIKRGVLGSYTMVFENGSTLKVKRVI